MGIFLYLETDPETPVCPHELTTADSKLFQNFQVLMDRPTWRAPDGTLTTLGRALRVDVSALGANSVADRTETSLEEYYEWFRTPRPAGLRRCRLTNGSASGTRLPGSRRKSCSGACAR